MIKLKLTGMMAFMLALVACGNSNPVVDGTDYSSTKKSLLTIYQSVTPKERTDLELDVLKIGKQYKDKSEFSKALNGKDVAGIREVAKGSSVWLLHRDRDFRLAEYQKDYDEIKAKSDNAIALDPRGADSPVYIASIAPRLNLASKKLDQLKAMSDEEYLKHFDLEF